MRKTRLVILPTKCLHQMGFLLLFLSCPVIGDWGRIRPESETLHEAIRVDREGTCGLQREPPGGLVHLLKDNGSKQCRLSEEFVTNPIIKKPIYREVRSDARLVDPQRNTQRRHTREVERRQTTDERKDVARAVQRRTAGERRDTRIESARRLTDERRVRRETQRTTNERRTINERQDTRRESRQKMSESNEIRSRSIDSRRSLRQPETSIRRQRLVTARSTQSDNEFETTRQRSGDRRTDRRSFREDSNERRENERRIRQERRFLSEDSRRSVQERSSRRRENDMTVRQTRDRSLERQTERLSLARREQNREIRSENGRNNERVERIRKTRSLDDIRDATEQRRTERERSDIRRNAKNRRLVNLPTERDVRERRVAPLGDKMDRNVDVKARRVTGATARQNLPEDITLEGKIAKEQKMSEKITQLMDMKKYENFKVGDWTTNCVIGAVVYFLSSRQIKSV